MSDERSAKFRSLKYLGSCEIKKSLIVLSSADRSTIVSFAIKKILQRYGRTNFANRSGSSTVNFDEFIGRSPMSNWNDTQCSIQISEESISVAVEENEICSLLFHHHISCISIATIDLFQPKLYCYVANQDALQRNSIRSDQQDRRLYLFECCDLLQTRKLIDETKKRFRVLKGQKTNKQKGGEPNRTERPNRPEKDSSPSIPPRPHRLPPPPSLPHYLNPH